jgi:hypothetical protein
VTKTDVTDSNAYLGKWPYWNMEVNTGDQLAKHLNRNGISSALVSSLRSAFADVEEGNLELLDACKKHPDTSRASGCIPRATAIRSRAVPGSSR